MDKYVVHALSSVLDLLISVLKEAPDAGKQCWLIRWSSTKMSFREIEMKCTCTFEQIRSNGSSNTICDICSGFNN